MESRRIEEILHKEFNFTRLLFELNNANFDYHFIQKDGANIGFTKINYHLTEQLFGKTTCELEKIYILSSYGRKGIGKWVIIQLIKHLREKGKRYILLGVLDSNVKAIHFYQSLGFVFHDEYRLQDLGIKEKFRGMNRMYLNLIGNLYYL